MMSVRFSSVTVTRSYEQIVRQIVDEIRRDTLVIGQKLPTERELSEQFGVSRSVVREAIKVLGAMGLVESRQGSGIYVRNDTVPTFTRAFTLSVSPEEKSLTRLFEFRRALEVLAARCAAERRSQEQAAEITAVAEATMRAATSGDIADFGAADRGFHAAIYAAADNPYLMVALSAVREMQHDVVALFAKFPGSMSTAAEHHMRVAAAIAAANSDAAAEAMHEHLVYTAETVDMIRKEASGPAAAAMKRSRARGARSKESST